jgi:Flp pilus assembly protein TadD
MSRRRPDHRRGGPARGHGVLSAPARSAIVDAAGERAAVALWLTLAALVAGRAAMSFVPGTWLWPLGLHRFLAPAAGWGLWLIAALALIPPLAGRAQPMLARWGDAIGRSPALTTTAWAVAAAALAWLMPDRVRFVGDFLLRQGTVEIAERPGALFPQALPLDVILHYTLPLQLTTAHLMDANGAARLLGALEAALLGGLAAAFARALELRGGGAFACAAVVMFGGYLGMFTGFSKAFAEMSVLVALAGVSAIAALRTGRGLLPLGLAVALGIVLHRSALGMYPALALVWGFWLARHGRGGAWKRPAALIAMALPLLALAIMAPRVIGTVMNTDTAVHFTPPTVRAQGGVLSAALAGTRPWDLVSLLLMLSPLALAIPMLAGLLGRRPGRGGEVLVLATLALPFAGVMAFIHPAQGLFRDWDDFAATGVALSLIAAWLVGETLRDTRRFAWLAVAVTLGVAVSAIQWLVVHTDTVRGLSRVRAFVTEPPVRPPEQRGTTWDYLGIRSFRLERYPEAKEAFAHAAETSPSPRILHEWALAAAMAGDDPTARDAYRRLLEKDPANNLGWLGLATAAMRLRDVPEAKRAATELARRDPSDAQAREILDEIARYEAMQSDSAGRGR